MGVGLEKGSSNPSGSASVTLLSFAVMNIVLIQYHVSLLLSLNILNKCNLTKKNAKVH